VPTEKLPRIELLRRVRYMPVTLTFRAKFSYNNIGYAAAGEAAANAAGMSWENALRARILKPLGIDGAALTGAELAKADNKAQQHAWLGDGIRRGKVSVMPTIALDTIGPAGSIAMSAEQLAKWVTVQLADGALPDGKRVWSEARAREMRTIVSPMPIADSPAGSPDKRPNFQGYALGWVAYDVDGHVVIQHSGAVPGQRATIAYVPDLKIGFAMTTSTDDGSVLQAITATLLDHYLKRPATDRIALVKSTTDAHVARLEAAQKKIEEAHATDAKLSADADQLIGAWHDKWFGNAVIARAGDGLTIKLSDATDMEGKLEPWQRDTFLVHWKDRNMGKAFVTVLRRPNDGTPERIAFTGTSPLGGPSFFDGLDFKRAK
jgi:CubicO group peptidase (beta-lactamase class C family)